MNQPHLEDRIRLMYYYATKFALSEASLVNIEKALRNPFSQFSGADVENICREAFMSQIRSEVFKLESSSFS